MASDLISRAAARDVINTWGRHENEAVRMVLLHNDINAIPAVDAVPVVHGHWINHFDDLFPGDSTIECSECHEHTHYMPDDNYCPNCGAKMDGGEGDE